MPTREPREITESFRIERVLKSSRSGIVFRALDPATGGSVAIKLIPPPAPVAMDVCYARFVALAELLTLLQPRGVPALHDHGRTPDDSAFLVMELVEGARLDTIEELAPARVVGVALSVVDTLAALAGRGIQHGNVSPDNVIVGSGDRAWLTGLGTAAMRPTGTVARVVLDGDAAEFAPPERFDPDAGGAADWRGDIYSLALTVCSLLKAEVSPMDGPAPTVRLPFEVAKGLRDPNILRATLEQSLRRSPEERPPSYDILRDAFRRALGAAPTVIAPPAAQPAVEPAAPPPADADPAASGGSGIDWEEPEGAPAWLQDSAPAFVLEKPEPREFVPPVHREKDEREDTNPIPVQRQAELGIRPKPQPPAAAPTVSAPQPHPTPAPSASAAAPAVPAPPPLPPAAPAPVAPPAPLALPDEAPPPPADMAQRARFRIPPIAVIAPGSADVPPSGPLAGPRESVAPAAALTPTEPVPTAAAAATPSPDSERRVDSTPPTGRYELPHVPPPAAAPPLEPIAAEAAAGVNPPPTEGSQPKPAEASPESEAEPPDEAPVTPAAAHKPGRVSARQPRWLVATLAAAAVVLVGIVGIVIGVQVLRSRQLTPVMPTPVPARPRPTGVPQAGPPAAAIASILTAEQAASSGDLAGAQAALDAITTDDELALGPADLGRLTRVRAEMTRLRLDSVLADLRNGLASGNLKALRDAVRRVTRDDEAALAGDPDTAQTLDEAKRATNLFGLATRAQQAGNSSQLLQDATALIELAPRSAQAAELREQAASGLEREIDVLLQQGRFDEAQERVATLTRYWSARSGLAQRVERVRDAQAADQRLATLLAQAEQAERDRQPDRGLDLLRSATPPAYYAERFRQESARLQALLQQMDANPPTLELPPGLKLEYSKNKPFALTVRITDDHAVKSASLFARVKGTDHYMETPLTRGPGSEWRGEINPAVHQNKTVEFYVVASDQSGHTGQAGSADQPLQLKRKWSLFGM